MPVISKYYSVTLTYEEYTIVCANDVLSAPTTISMQLHSPHLIRNMITLDTRYLGNYNCRQHVEKIHALISTKNYMGETII